MIKENKTCPCHYLYVPCNPRCSCLNMFSSTGCANCCGYGSIEQRKEQAIRLNFKNNGN